MAQQIGLGGFGVTGLLPQFRATIFRIRSTIRRPTMLTQAQRVVVTVNTTATELRFIASFTVGGGIAELYGFYVGEDIHAVMSVYYDTTAAKYVFNIARNTWDPTNVKFDDVNVGTAPTFPAVTSENVVSLGFVTVSGAAK